MSEEEKKAIEIIKQEITKPETTPLEVYVTDIKMLLHIIDKQQKEIEELKSEFAINTEIHKRDLKIKELKEINECLHQTDKELFVSKDKIKEKINYYEERGYIEIAGAFKLLLEEN